MNKKTIKRISGGMAIYYGISSAIAAITGVIGLGTWVYRVLVGHSQFTWGALIGIIAVTAFMSFMAYSLLRVGYEEIEK